jgi:outer membrane protein insertion porin family
MRLPFGFSFKLVPPLLLACLLLGPERLWSATETPIQPEFSVRGLGLFGNRKMTRVIRQVHPEEVQRATFDANFVEDVFVILRNQLVNEGYLNTAVRARVTPAIGEDLSVAWDGAGELLVPRPLAARRIVFQVERGRRFYFDEFAIEGLTALPARVAQGFFFKGDMLLRLRASRRFNLAQFERSLNNLRQELVNRGHRDATVVATRLERDDRTGRVNVTVTVTEGPLHRVGSVAVREQRKAGATNPPVRVLQPGVPWSPLWEQDYEHRLRVEQYRRGRPDAVAELRRVRSEQADDEIVEHLEAIVQPGPLVRLGEVRFEGQQKARTNWLARRSRLEGPLLDRMAVESSRERLSRQGIFNFVGVRYEPPDGETRDVVFELTEGRRVEFNLLAGYGSYDQLFGGLEWSQFNLWGVGHQSRLRAMQSFKTSNVLYTYGIPEMLFPGLSVFGNIDALRREELSFERQELKLGVGARKSFPRPGLQFGLRYSYEFLNAAEDGTGLSIDTSDFTRVAALILEGQWDRRDNPLAPRRGHRIYTVVEAADPAWGSDAPYQLAELGAAVHVPLISGLILHGNVQHGIAFAGDSANNLPFNKRFFPGGENSVRGYQRGEASPLDADGRQLGAEVYLQGNLELEQYLTERWALVAFVDTVGIAERRADYPAAEWLWSAGGGLRWNSIIGPVRIEYGHNLTPRPGDPKGTLHLSIGFPF